MTARVYVELIIFVLIFVQSFSTYTYTYTVIQFHEDKFLRKIDLERKPLQYFRSKMIKHAKMAYFFSSTPALYL